MFSISVKSYIDHFVKVCESRRVYILLASSSKYDVQACKMCMMDVMLTFLKPYSGHVNVCKSPSINDNICKKYRMGINKQQQKQNNNT